MEDDLVYVVVWTWCAGYFDRRHVGALRPPNGGLAILSLSTLHSGRPRQASFVSLVHRRPFLVMPFYQMLCITAHYNEYVRRYLWPLASHACSLFVHDRNLSRISCNVPSTIFGTEEP